jgi:hypothetical protein
MRGLLHQASQHHMSLLTSSAKQRSGISCQSCSNSVKYVAIPISFSTTLNTLNFINIIILLLYLMQQLVLNNKYWIERSLTWLIISRSVDCFGLLLLLLLLLLLHFSSLECMLRLYITLVRSKIEYASVVWNSITSTDANKLERIQQRFAALCFKRFFNPEVPYCYSFVLEELKLLTRRVRRHRLDAFFLTQVYSGSKFYPSVLEIAGLRVPAGYSRNVSLFSSSSSCKHSPSARFASAANDICRDADVFAARHVLLNCLF